MSPALPRWLMVVWLGLLPAAPAAAGDSFLAELEDLPLAPGLSEQPGGMLFDSADGRIIEASASGPVSADSVRRFYPDTLRQLGWQQTGPLSFHREREDLRIVLDAGGDRLTVHFTLTPTR